MHPILRIVIFLSLTAVSHLYGEAPAVLGRIGDIEVTTDQLRESLAGIEGANTNTANNPQALGQYARALLLQRLVLQQAREQKWDQDPAVISRMVRAREAALSESYLESKSKPDASYPSEQEIKDAYEANKSKLLIPKSYELAQIFIESPESGDAATQAKAKSKLEEVRKQLAAKDADFSSIARTSSDEKSSAENGGKIGWLAENQIQPEIRSKLPNLKLKAVSEPIRLNAGWHIIKLLDVREARPPTLDEIRDNLVTSMREEKSRELRQNYITELLKKHPLAINEIELMKLAK
jgi:parvulin-like peptidyl-prolyl isomerase